ncbi:MAG: DNA polymerase III subunit chi [Alphaproteobacteria bacterium]|jgi:DNA polymerase-3 subunit chi|nr:DNA polymerase III subunit chi [Alphaproteobacteria bacterium]
MKNEKAEVTLYQLTTHPLEKVLPRILEKVYDGGLHALVLTDTQERMQALNASLWTYSSLAFLPHGMDGNKLHDPADNPIWLSLDADNKNNATILVLTAGKSVEDLSPFTRCVDIFDGNDPTSLAAGLERCDHYRKQGHPVVYWKQSLSGNWDQVS